MSNFTGFLDSSVGKGSAGNAGNTGSGRSPGEGIGLPTLVFLGFPVAQLVKKLITVHKT